MIHMKCQDYSLKKIKVKLFSTAVVIGALRVKWSYTFYTLGHFFLLFRQLIYMNRQSQLQQTTILTFFFLFATENKSWHFMWMVLADNSHEMSTLVFSENRENKLRLSSTTNFAWHFMSQMCSQTRITSKDFSAQVSLINDTRSFTVTAGKIKELIDSYRLNYPLKR